MNFKNFYKKYIYRQKRQDFLHYVGISRTSLIFYLNGRIPRKRVIKKNYRICKRGYKTKPNYRGFLLLIKHQKNMQIEIDKFNLEYILKQLGYEVEAEFKFCPTRKFRADWKVSKNDKCVLVEYEGLMSNKSRHSSPKGYSNDCEKYNLMTSDNKNNLYVSDSVSVSVSDSDNVNEQNFF